MTTSLDKKIRIRMIEKDLTGSEIARRIGIHRSAINRVIKGERKTLRLRKAIASELQLKFKELWPEGNK